jgi:hypothetical protein
MRWFWGLLILSLGVVFLAQNIGLWGTVSNAQIVQFWPLMLILFGISLIAKNLRFGWIIIIVSFVLAIMFIHFTLINQSMNNFVVLRVWDPIKNFRR